MEKIAEKTLNKNDLLKDGVLKADDKVLKNNDKLLQNSINKRIRVNTGLLIIEGLLTYYGPKKYNESINGISPSRKEFIGQDQEAHLNKIRFFFPEDNTEIKSESGTVNVGFYVFTLSEIKHDIELVK